MTYNAGTEQTGSNGGQQAELVRTLVEVRERGQKLKDQAGAFSTGVDDLRATRFVQQMRALQESVIGG